MHSVPVNPASLALLTLLLLTSGPAGAADWQGVREEEGIVVSSLTQPGEALPVLRGVVRIDRPVDDVLAWIRDVSTHTQWMHNCTEARRVQEDGDTIVIYNRTSPHWAISDRDVVLRSVLIRSSEDGSARVEFRATDEVDLRPDDSVVRMPRLEGHYDLRPDPAGGTRVEYQVSIDPGGALPDWLVERSTSDLPYFTLRNLREKVESADVALGGTPSK